MDDADRRRRTTRIERALWIVMGLLAFLAKDNPDLVYPQALYLFLCLLAASLCTSLSVRRLPERGWLHALCVVAGLASIVGLQEWSGGPESNLWTLYLLPIFSSTVLFEARELTWTAAGACACNAAVHLLDPEGVRESTGFTLALETGILATAAAATWTFSKAEREADARASAQRGQIDRLERAQAEARERDRGLSAIAAGGAGAAHDMTTPLMVIRAYSAMHLERGLEDAELSQDLARIDAAAAFCQELVAGLLARASGTATPRALRDAVLSAAAMAEPILKSRRLVLDAQIPAEAMIVLASGQDLERIVLNLIGNAVKVLPEGGSVRVRVARDEGDKPRATVRVEDDGPGIPAEILPRLFQPFATSKPGAGGTGLGLFVSRAAARRLGGDLFAENLPGRGARFTLWLPLVEAPRAEPARGGDAVAA